MGCGRGGQKYKAAPPILLNLRPTRAGYGTGTCDNMGQLRRVRAGPLQAVKKCRRMLRGNRPMKPTTVSDEDFGDRMSKVFKSLLRSQ